MPRSRPSSRTMLALAAAPWMLLTGALAHAHGFDHDDPLPGVATAEPVVLEGRCGGDGTKRSRGFAFDVRRDHTLSLALEAVDAGDETIDVMLVDPEQRAELHVLGPDAPRLELEHTASASGRWLVHLECGTSQVGFRIVSSHAEVDPEASSPFRVAWPTTREQACRGLPSLDQVDSEGHDELEAIITLAQTLENGHIWVRLRGVGLDYGLGKHSYATIVGLEQPVLELHCVEHRCEGRVPVRLDELDGYDHARVVWVEP